ncbi:MAG: hypothetical protein ABL897_00735, partial [Hyphomicrobium sp.]
LVVTQVIVLTFGNDPKSLSAGVPAVYSLASIRISTSCRIFHARLFTKVSKDRQAGPTAVSRP